MINYEILDKKKSSLSIISTFKENLFQFLFCLFTAICKTPCKNGGKCTKPDTCHCKTGYYGKHCELDVNECITEKPCDQTCYNTEGSYYCTCREGFILQQNKQSCKKVDTSYSGSNEGGNAFEARDLENDVDIEDLGLKISNIEKVIILFN